MINTNHLNIDNIQSINRLLPWWVRGRRVILFLSAIAYPLVWLHNDWKKWALERLIEAKTTSQRKSLAWYLNYKLRSHFNNSSDSFQISDNYTKYGNYIFPYAQRRRATELTVPVVNGGDCEYKGDTMITYNLNEKQVDVNNIVIFAPTIKSGTTYFLENYKYDILKLAHKYITNNQKIYIVYNEGIINW